MRTLLTLCLLFSAPLLMPSNTVVAASAAHSPGMMVGRVVDANGAPVADARVQIEMTLRSGRTYMLETSTNRRGVFGFDRLPQSRGVVRAAKRGVGRDRERATVLWGKTTRVSLELQ